MSNKKYIILGFVILILAIGGFFYNKKNENISPNFIIAQKNNIEQIVSVTGAVKPVDKVDLAFNLSGRVSHIYVDVGDKVFVGQKLIDLDDSQSRAQYNRAKANLSIELSKLKELKDGTRKEELAIQKVKVSNAKQAFSDAKNNLVDKIKDAYTKSDDAIRNKVDQLFNSPRSFNPKLSFITSPDLENLIETERLSLGNTLKVWNKNLSNDSDILNSISDYNKIASNNLQKINNFLNNMALAVNGMVVNSSVSQSMIDKYKSEINIARGTVNKAISNLSLANSQLNASKSSLSLSQQELDLKEAGATEDEIKIQEARVKSAESNLNNYGALIAKSVIFSPINGIVTKKNIEKGEIVQPNMDVLSIISGTEFKIEANIPESDIAKVKIGNLAKVTLDAYGDEVIFRARVTSIDPAETMIDGIATYKTTLLFIDKDKRVKSGMTANIDILTNKKNNVITVPQRAIVVGGEYESASLLNNQGKVTKVKVVTGLRGSKGNVEIIKGIKEGDKVITDN